MTVKEIFKTAEQYNKAADTLDILGDGGKRAVVYLVYEYSPACPCEYVPLENYKAFKAYIDETFHPIVVKAFKDYDFKMHGGFETVGGIDPWGVEVAARVGFSVHAE